MKHHHDDFAAALTEACQGLDLSAQSLQQMAQHWDLVQRWNARTNLTAVSAAFDAAWLHYYDSLAGLARLSDGPIVDFGSGAGYPGIPLAIARPTWRFTLVEPRRKRVSFLETVVARLGLQNVHVLAGKLQDTPDGAYAHAVTRATFSDIADLRAAAAWLRPGGTLIAYRGADAAAPGTETYAYDVQGAARRLEIWRFAA